MILTQVLPFFDEKVVGTWMQLEAAIYAGLPFDGLRNRE